MNENKDLKLRVPDAIGAGVYANNTMVTHTREEFIMDFLMLAPPAGTVVSRVILSPGHLKRLIHTLEENLQKFETKFGQVMLDEIPPTKMGFSA